MSDVLFDYTCIPADFLVVVIDFEENKQALKECIYAGSNCECIYLG